MPSATVTVPRDPEAWVKLGKMIRENREAAGYSRRALAEKAGVSEKSIQVAEEGRVPRGRMPQSLSRIEEALDWMPGAYIAILNGKTWGKFELQEVTVQLESEADEEARKAAAEHAVPAGSMSSREVELTQSGHLAQDVFMRQARRYRNLLGLSIEEVASKLAGAEPILTQEDIRRLENGTRLLHASEAQAIAKALDTTVDWLLGSGFSNDAPEEMRWPPNDKELEAEANAVMRRISDAGAQVNAAQQRAMAARERAAHAHAEADMAATILQSAVAQQQEMEKHYQYLLGRIDSIRVARGEETAIQFRPVYEDEENRAEEGALLRPAPTASGDKAGTAYPGSKAQHRRLEEAARNLARKLP